MPKFLSRKAKNTEGVRKNKLITFIKRYEF